MIPKLLPSLMSGITLDMIKPVMVMHSSFMIPTPVGLPISLNGTAMTIATIKGTIRVSNLMSTSKKITITKDAKIE